MSLYPKNKTVIILVGPTAVGKTAVAIELAKYFGTEIISADSRQCYQELSIGVARPSEQELKTITHHFIASHSVRDVVTAATFEQTALKISAELFRNQSTVIMTGGTGLYIKAFCEGLDEIPAIKEEIRQTVITNYNEKGFVWLQEQIKQKDPDFYRQGEIQNPQRMMRALEVMESTGKSVLSFRTGKKARRDFDILKIGLELPKEELHRNIAVRTDQMIAQGLLEEVKSLQRSKNLNALQTVGYAEIFDFLAGKTSLETAIELIKQNTRQYAKRQLTWFRRDKETRWFHPAMTAGIKEYLCQQTGK